MNSDHYDRNQTTDLNNSPTRYHPTTALTSFVVYNSACRPNLPQNGLRGGRGVREVGVATLNTNSVKKQRINAKNEPSKCSGLAISRRRQINLRDDWSGIAEARLEKDIFVRTHLHTARIVVRVFDTTIGITLWSSSIGPIYIYIYLRRSRDCLLLCSGG